jgi:hypothetical protein
VSSRSAATRERLAARKIATSRAWAGSGPRSKPSCSSPSARRSRVAHCFFSARVRHRERIAPHAARERGGVSQNGLKQFYGTIPVGTALTKGNNADPEHPEQRPQHRVSRDLATPGCPFSTQVFQDNIPGFDDILAALHIGERQPWRQARECIERLDQAHPDTRWSTLVGHNDQAVPRRVDLAHDLAVLGISWDPTQVLGYDLPDSLAERRRPRGIKSEPLLGLEEQMAASLGQSTDVVDISCGLAANGADQPGRDPVFWQRPPGKRMACEPRQDPHLKAGATRGTQATRRRSCHPAILPPDWPWSGPRSYSHAGDPGCQTELISGARLSRRPQQPSDSPNLPQLDPGKTRPSG